MKNFLRMLSVPVLLLLPLAACTGGKPLPVPPPAPAPNPGLTDLDDVRARTEWPGRWLIRLPDDLSAFPAAWRGSQTQENDCPTPPTWTTERLFSTTAGTPVVQGSPDSLNEEMTRYCVYISGNAEEGGDLRAVTANGEPVFAGAVPQRNIVGYFAHLDKAVHAHNWSWSADRTGAGRNAQGQAGNDAVRLEILDTAASGQVTSARPGKAGIHGHALANMARSILCNEQGSCAAEIHRRQAMDQVMGPGGVPTTGSPGHFGSMEGLAKSIHSAVSEYRSRRDPDGDGTVDRPERLVLNLSLAWHPDHGGTDLDPRTWEPDVRAVYTALQEAACNEVLVMASAGNRGTGPSGQDGIMLPALWQRADSWSKCTAVGTGYQAERNLDGQPVLYAVSGVDRRGLALPNARENAWTHFAAYGDQVPGTGDAQTPGVTWTGTSVSAIVASSAVAVHWTSHGSVSPYVLMRDLYTGGTAAVSAEVSPTLTENAADPFQGNTVRLLGMCESAGTVSCSTSTIIAVGDLSEFQALAAQIASIPGPGVSPADCGGRLVYRDASVPSSNTVPVCPEVRAYGTSHMPTVGPQPPKGECPYCIIDMTDMSNPRANLDFDTELAEPYSISLKTRPAGGGPSTIEDYVYDHQDLVATPIGVQTYYSAEINLTGVLTADRQLLDAWVTAYAAEEPTTAVVSTFSVNGL